MPSTPRPGLFAALAALALAGCTSDGPTPPSFDDHPVHLSPASQWAGRTVAFSSSAFGEWPDSIFFGADSFLFLAKKADDTTFQVTLPDTLPGGHYSIHGLSSPESPNFQVGLDVAGWLDTRSVTVPGTTNYSTPWPAGAPTGLIVIVNDTPRFVRASTGEKVTLPLGTTSYRVALGHDADGHLLAPHDADTLIAWNVDVSAGTASIATKIPYYTDPDNSYYRFGASGSVYTNHNTAVFDPGELQGLSYATAPRPAWSTATGRVVIPFRALDPDAPGIPIYRTDSGTVGATVAGYSRLDAATFDGAGTTLYLAAATGGLASTTQSLLRVDALTGAVVDSVAAASDPRVEDLLLQPTQGRLLEAVRSLDRWELRIRDASTLALIADVRSPASLDDGCRAEAELHLIPSPATNEVYIGSAACNAGEGEVHFARFSLK